MSAMPTRTATPEPRRTWRPRLHVVRNPAPAWSLVPYLLLCVAILLGSLVGALLINTHMAVTAYEIHDSQRELNRAREAGTSLIQQVEEAGAPGNLHRRATELGMSQAEGIGYISLTDGTVLGGSEAPE